MGVSSTSGVAARDRISHPGIRTNNYYLASLLLPSSTTSTINFNTIYYQPIAISGTINRIGIEVTAGSAGAARLGLYSNNNGIPGTLILDAGTVDVTSIAIVEATTADTILSGEWIWMAIVSNATPTLRAGGVGAAMILGATAPSASGIRGYGGALAYGALPAAAPAISGTSSVTPAIWLRAV